MSTSDPPDQERRGSPRAAPSYTPDQIDELSIVRIHFREDYLFALLSDGKMLCVPLSISPVLAAAPHRRYQWRISEGGKEVLWYIKGMGFATARLNLYDLLAHPEAQMSDLPSP
jgi:hypothetical protein